MSLVSAVNTIMLERCGDEARRRQTPTAIRCREFAAREFRLGRSVMALAHRAARQEDQQIDRQIAEHQQRDGRAGENAGAERHVA